MNHGKFRRLFDGKVPRVIGTITALGTLRDFPQAHTNDCDIAEVRLDMIGEGAAWEEPARRIEEAGVPVLLTLRTVAEGGKSTLSVPQTVELIERSWTAFTALDVEHHWPAARELARSAEEHQKTVVTSFHDFKRTPPIEKLLEIARAGATYADIVKISTFVRTAGDIAILESLLGSSLEKPLCVIGMGPLGTRTRIEFPRKGSCLTYGYLDAPAAPGQLSARELVGNLRQSLPAYEAEFARKRSS